MSSPKPPILSTGGLELSLNPSIGGSISALEWIEGDRRVPVLRKCNSCPENVLEAASFPLVPYVNRIRGGRFDFRGREVTLAPNMAGDPSPLHGQGWLASWQVESESSSETVLSFRHSPGEWPWEYRAEQHFELDEAGLSLRLICRNLSDEPMPCGLGQHPYFHCGPETRLDTNDRSGLALRRRAGVPGRALLPALFAGIRRHLRRRAGQPRQRRPQRAGR